MMVVQLDICLIELSQSSDGMKFWFNIDHLVSMGRYKDRTIIVYGDDENAFYNVKETPEEIINMLKKGKR